MPTHPLQLCEEFNRFFRGYSTIEDSGIAGDSNESCFGQQTRCPAVLTVSRKPSSRRCIVYMARPRQCNKDVNIQQRRHGQSLSASLTSSLVTGRECASTRKEGMPSTNSNSPVPLNPRRASSDTALPRLLPLRSANARATASTSSSIVSVVRIMASYHQGISLSRCESRANASHFVGLFRLRTFFWCGSRLFGARERAPQFWRYCGTR